MNFSTCKFTYKFIADNLKPNLTITNYSKKKKVNGVTIGAKFRNICIMYFVNFKEI